MNLKDISVRYRRMRGDDALFIPSSDHAGFETWVVYEIPQSRGKSRLDFSREELYDQVGLCRSPPRRHGITTTRSWHQLQLGRWCLYPRRKVMTLSRPSKRCGTTS